MTDRSRAIADEAIRQAREACYGDANVGNTIEGDYGKWDDWRDMIEEVVERSCERLSHAEAEREAWCASYHAAQSDVRSVEAKLAAAEAECKRLRDLNDALYKSQTAANQECEIAEDKLAAAEARFNEMSTPTGREIELLQRLAAAEARVKELESRGILNMDEVVNQFYEGE